MLSKNITIKNSTFKELNNGKFNKSYSDVIDALITEKQYHYREIGLLKREIEILKLRIDSNE